MLITFDNLSTPTKNTYTDLQIIKLNLQKINEILGTYVTDNNGILDAEAIIAQPYTQNSFFLTIAGGALTGNLYANSDPTAPLQVATKEYVDNIDGQLQSQASELFSLLYNTSTILQVELNQLNNILTADLSNINTELANLTGDYNTLLNNINYDNEQIITLTNEFSTLNSTIDIIYNDYLQLANNLNLDVISINENITNTSTLLQNQINNLTSETNVLQNEINNLSNIETQLTNTDTNLQNEINAINSTLSNYYNKSQINSSFLNTSGGTITGGLTILGNLDVQGTNTFLDSTTMNVGDNFIFLNQNATSAALDSGLSINRGVEPSANLIWNETIDAWQITNNSGTYNKIISEFDNTTLGVLILGQDPTTPLGAATKEYVDNTSTTLSGQINNLQNNYNTLSSNLSNATNQLLSDISTITNLISNTSNTIQTILSDINTLENDNTSLETQLNSVNTSLSNNVSSINNLSSEYSTLANEINNEQAQLNNLNANLNNNYYTITQTNSTFLPLTGGSLNGTLFVTSDISTGHNLNVASQVTSNTVSVPNVYNFLVGSTPFIDMISGTGGSGGTGTWNQTLAVPGGIVFPNGYIMNWGTTNKVGKILFPYAYSTQVFYIMFLQPAAGSTYQVSMLTTNNLSSFKVTRTNFGFGPSLRYWFSAGY